MNKILTGIKNRLEEKAHIKVYRNSMPHGTDLARDISRHFSRAELGIIFDIGANVGQTALEYSQRFPNSAVYSFEPVASTFALLQKNTRHLRRFNSYNLAFGEASGEFPMVICEDSRLNTLALNRAIKSTNHQTEMVKVTTLDRFAGQQGIQSIDLLKIDAEGHDLEILKGAEELLSGGRINFIQVETGFGDSTSHITLTQFIQFLHQYGYAVFGIYEQQPYWTGEPWLMYANAVFVRKGLADVR